jgi:hypothetical protein
MSQICNRIAGLCVATTAGVLVAACDASKSSNPLSPSIAGPIAGVSISAPASLRPTGGTAIGVDQPLVMSFNAASSNSPRTFWYEVEIGTVPDFTAIVFRSVRIEHPEGATQINFNVPTRLPADRTYYWRVRALDGSNTGPYADPAMFKVSTPIVLGAPEPVSPVSGATTPTQPTFVVNAGSVSGPAGTLTYEFQVASDTGFGQIASAFTAPASSGPTTSATSGTLGAGQTYFWRVRQTDGSAVSNWAATAHFLTQAPALTLNCPANQNATSADGLPVPVSYPAAVPGGGVSPVTLNYSQPSGRPFNLGTTVVTVTATDAAQQKAECTFSVTVAAAPPPPPPPAAPPPSTGGGGGSGGGSEGDELDPNQIIWLDHDVRNFAVTSTITSVRAGGPVCIEHTKAGKWPVVDGGEGNPWVFANINGQWYGATYEWLRPGQICKGVTREDIGPHTKEPPLETWRPRSGELVGFMVSTQVRFGPWGPKFERSNIVLVRWP